MKTWKKFSLVMAMVLVVVCFVQKPLVSKAGAPGFKLNNNTGFTITQMYKCYSFESEFNETVVDASNYVYNDGSVEVTYPEAPAGDWDLAIVLEDQVIFYYYNLPVNLLMTGAEMDIIYDAEYGASLVVYEVGGCRLEVPDAIDKF